MTKVVQVEEWDHSPLGPSASERWLNCPGSVKACEGIPDKTSTYAVQGTAAHTVTEWCRLQECRAEKFKGTIVKVPDCGQVYEIEVDQEMVDAVNYFLDYVETFNGEMLVEAKVHYDAWVPHGFGTSDDMRVDEKLCVITDFKYGEGVQVFADDNPQLKLYALGWYHDFGWLYPDVTDFQLNICQPRLDHIDEFKISLADLLVWANTEVAPMAEIAMKDGAPFAAGSWCQFCRIKKSCRTRAETIFNAVVGDFDDLDEKTPIDTVIPNTLTLDEVALLLPFLPEIKKFCTDLEHHALSEIGKGKVITHPVMGDYKIVEGRSVTTYKQIDPDPELNEQAILKRFKSNRVPMSQAYKKKLISITQLKKLIGAKHSLIEELSYKPPGKPKLAPGTDKRPAITIDPESEFDDESEED